MNISFPHKQGTGPLGGFTALPHKVFDRLLCLDLTKRELLILLLVARLTYGCQRRGWIHLRQADLQVVGIGANHARDCLDSLLRRGLLVQNGSNPEYRLGSLDHAEAVRRLHLLEKVVGRQLAQSSRTGKRPDPRTGTHPFPPKELAQSQQGKPKGRSAWQFDRYRRQFVRARAAGDI